MMRRIERIGSVGYNKGMAKQKRHDISFKKKGDEVIEINPFDVERKIRKPLPPPSKTHRDKTKYNRKQKHKRAFGVND